MFESTARNPDGYVARGDAQGRPVEADTRQCCHCGQHFEMVKGSGKRRGFCLKCAAITCGASGCDPCIPLEARLDHLEGSKSSHTEKINKLIAEGAIVL